MTHQYRRPLNMFEEVMSELQPECDIIFEKYGQDEESKYGNRQDLGFKKNENHKKGDMQLASYIQKMGFAPLYRLPHSNDIRNMDNVEKETVFMMRSIGMGPSVDYPLYSVSTEVKGVTNEKSKNMLSNNKAKASEATGMKDDKDYRYRCTTPKQLYSAKRMK